MELYSNVLDPSKRCKHDARRQDSEARCKVHVVKRVIVVVVDDDDMKESSSRLFPERIPTTEAHRLPIPTCVPLLFMRSPYG